MSNHIEAVLDGRTVVVDLDASDTDTSQIAVARCAWFAACPAEATHLHPHPILGAVAACDHHGA